MSTVEIFWIAWGFGAQACFTARFLVQWMASEKEGKSVIPIAFWYLSLSGGLGLLIYAISQRDPVIITGQGFGVIVYLRNLILIHRKRAAERLAEQGPDVVALPERQAPLREAG